MGVQLKTRDFIYVFSKGATDFHRQVKCFELNFFKRKTFLWMFKPDRQNSTQLFNLHGAQPLMKPLENLQAQKDLSDSEVKPLSIYFSDIFETQLVKVKTG